MRQFVFEDVVHEWFGNHEHMIFNNDVDDMNLIISNYMFVNMKKKEKKSKKEKEYKDLMNQILNHIDVTYKCNYYVEKEVEHSYSPSAPISFLVR
jgi:hypothetical protein